MDDGFLLIFLIIIFVFIFRSAGKTNRSAKYARPKAKKYRSKSASSTSRAKARTRLPSEKAPHRPPPEIPPSKQLIGRAWVIDGDTIAIGKVKIRLAGIDAPELDQPWGQKSKWEMVRMCKGQTLRAELTGETSYDRLVGTCYLPDGRDIGAEIIKAGLALDGSYYSKGKYRHLEPDGVRNRLKFYGHWRK